MDVDESVAARNRVGRWPRRIRRLGTGHIRLVRSGGALMRRPMPLRVPGAPWKASVFRAYGTTETLGYATSEESRDTLPRKLGSVGVVRPGVEVAIRSDDGNALQVGVIGEITVRGLGVFSRLSG